VWRDDAAHGVLLHLLELRQQHRLRLNAHPAGLPLSHAIPELSLGTRVARPALPPLERYVEALQEIWDRGTLSNNGPFLRAFEEAFVGYSRSGGHMLAASSCDVALTLLIAALDLPRGARAVLPSLGFPSTVHALEWNGLLPRFVDVDPGDWCLHAEQLEGELEGVAVIVATHMFGVPCDVRGLEALAAEREIALVFDAAQAAGTWVGDRHAADFGDASAISFSGTKIVTAAEGAIAVLHGERTAERFARLRGYGMDERGTSEHRGLNAKLSELHAALALITLDDLEAQVTLRQRLVDSYRERLAPRGDVALQQISAASRPTPTFFAVDLREARNRVRAALAARGIESRPYFPPLHHMPRFTGVPRSSLPVTDRLGRGLLALPLHSRLAPSIVEEICDVVDYALDGSQMLEG
jgi:dTDP-4-amino-4,6-dideoxygalactose transaminase